MVPQTRQQIILDVTTDTDGTTYRVGRKSGQHLFVATITGTATVHIQGRQNGEAWQDLVTTTATAEINVDNYGWYDFRAISTGMGLASTAKVVWSWP